jgi:hypothetical protein
MRKGGSSWRNSVRRRHRPHNRSSSKVPLCSQPRSSCYWSAKWRSSPDHELLETPRGKAMVDADVLRDKTPVCDQCGRPMQRYDAEGRFLGGAPWTITRLGGPIGRSPPRRILLCAGRCAMLGAPSPTAGTTWRPPCASGSCQTRPSRNVPRSGPHGSFPEEIPQDLLRQLLEKDADG